MTDKDLPAFLQQPVDFGNGPDNPTGYGMGGLTLQQYAAIHLLQPSSGLDWLDDMIRARMRDEMAAKALESMRTSKGAYQIADAMMKQREGK